MMELKPGIYRHFKGKSYRALMLAKHVVNAEVFPIERKISDEIRKKVDEYLFKATK